MAVLRGAVVPIHVRYDQVLLIHWRREDGCEFIEQRTIPPTATIEAKAADVKTVAERGGHA